MLLVELTLPGNVHLIIIDETLCSLTNMKTGFTCCFKQHTGRIQASLQLLQDSIGLLQGFQYQVLSPALSRSSPGSVFKATGPVRAPGL